MKGAFLLTLSYFWLANGQPIFLYPSRSTHDTYIELDPEQANIVLSHHLRLDSFSETYFDSANVFGENDRNFEQYLKQVAHSGGNFVGHGLESAMIVSVESHSADFVPDELQSNIVELFIPGNDPNEWSFTPTINTYLHRAGRLYSSISTSLIPPPHYLDINVFTTSKSPSVKQYLMDLTAIADFVEKETPSVAQFGGFSIRGIYGIFEEFGPQSEEYITAVEALKATLQRAIELNMRIAVLLSPSSELPAEMEQMSGTIEKRQVQPPQSPLPPNQNRTLPPQEPLYSTSTCFASLDICTNSTNSCSGHGTCTNATRIIKGEQKTCFICACQATVSGRGSKEVWVGTACEKKDVSGPFVLLAGTTIAILVITIGTIRLLTSIGDEQLPGVLTAGATGGVASLKRH